jgi:hypothetical protein
MEEWFYIQELVHFVGDKLVYYVSIARKMYNIKQP